MSKFRSLSAFTVVAFLNAFLTQSQAEALLLPLREKARPETTNGEPHVQIGVDAVPALSEELQRRVAEFPDVRLGPTRVSLPGAVGFQLAGAITLARPEAIVGGREFAHLHPDGSLHASLSPEIALAAVAAGWAISHPWANQRPGWEGLVMIYSPSSEEELEVVLDLLRNSYGYVTGRSIPE